MQLCIVFVERDDALHPLRACGRSPRPVFCVFLDITSTLFLCLTSLTVLADCLQCRDAPSVGKLHCVNGHEV